MASLYVCSACIDAKLIEDGYHINRDVYLQDGSIIQGKNSTYYIGNTAKYLLNNDIPRTTIYPMSEIKKIEF